MWKTSAKMAAVFLLILLFSRVSQISCSYFSQLLTMILVLLELHQLQKGTALYLYRHDWPDGVWEPGVVESGPACGRGFRMKWSSRPLSTKLLYDFMLAWIIPLLLPLIFLESLPPIIFLKFLQVGLLSCLSPINSVSPISDFSKCVS